jgi:N-acetylmuramoyl-L-alanine amidase
MNIDNHRIAGCWHGPSPNAGGALVKPSLLVLHFTASGGTDPSGDVAWFMSPEAKAAAHLIVGRNGAVKQVVAFDVKAWHAGKSIWRGRPNCNNYSIGIEIDNWGRLVKTADGQMRSYTGAAVDPSRAALLQHKHETSPSYWELYTEEQLTRTAELVRLLLAAYPSIGEIVGHEDIAPGRKTDPGPAFPLSRFVSLATGRGDAATVKRTVTASRLNARGGPGTQFDTLGQFLRGTKVAVLYDAPGAWAQVEGVLEDGAKVTAWVADEYLA